MSTDTRSTVKIVTFLLMLSAAALLLVAIAAGVAFNHKAKADTVLITTDPFTINGVTPPVVHFAQVRASGLFQAVYKLETTGPDYLIECRDGFPCACRPLGQFQSYNLWDASPVALGLDPASTSVAFNGNTITMTDSQPVRTHPGDWNGDGAVSVTDIIDYLGDFVAGTTSIGVADFLTDYFRVGSSPIVCPCQTHNFPLSLHRQGLASDTCYEQYKRMTLSAYQEFERRLAGCKQAPCLDCSCAMAAYLEWAAEDAAAWRLCGE